MNRSFSVGRLTLAACGLLALAGCSTPPPVVAPPAPATIAAPAVSASGPASRGGGTYAWSDKLGASAQRLRSDLNGGDVAVSQTTDQRLWISLAADTTFATGRAAIKAPASAWLDKVALALRNHPQAEVQIVSDSDGPTNDNASRALALDRAASARDWMVMRGVAAQRVAVAGRSALQAGAAPRRLDILIGERAR